MPTSNVINNDNKDHRMSCSLFKIITFFFFLQEYFILLAIIITLLEPCATKSYIVVSYVGKFPYGHFWIGSKIWKIFLHVFIGWFMFTSVSVNIELDYNINQCFLYICQNNKLWYMFQQPKLLKLRCNRTKIIHHSQNITGFPNRLLCRTLKWQLLLKWMNLNHYLCTNNQ